MTNLIYFNLAVDTIENSKRTHNNDIVDNTIDRVIEAGITINDEYYG